MTLRQQFHRPEESDRLTALERHIRRRRRIALIIATAIAKAHIAQHGTECEVDLTHKRLRKRVTTVTVSIEDLFAD